MRHEELFKAILSLETMDECEAFFRDIATDSELDGFSDRLHIAKLLIEGQTYEQITTLTQISSATIARVNRAITYGDNGYRTAIERISKK